MGKLLVKLGSLTLVWQPLWEKVNFEYKPVEHLARSERSVKIFIYISVCVCVCVCVCVGCIYTTIENGKSATQIHFVSEVVFFFSFSSNGYRN